MKLFSNFFKLATQWQFWVASLLWGIGLFFTAFLIVSIIIVANVFWGNHSNLKKTSILSRINEETSIYYLDEETRVGSFFDQAHRRYIPIQEVPAHLINAIIASEDKNYYKHFGVDPFAIGLAFAEGLRAGEFRRGGSTITQQTVKNLLDQRERTFTRKFKEVIAALALERMYDKRQILEFYLNQFHVAANGNGIGIAALYYFNKEVKDLDLVEAAFIAGSVKGPSKYNPFIKFTPEEREKAKVYANERKNYVLGRMKEQKWIDEATYKQAVETPVPFNRGKFRTSEVALISLIRSQLKRKEVLRKLNLESDEDLNNAGLRVFTTLDGELQEKMQLAMRRNLSRLETILQPYKPEDSSFYSPLRDLEVNQFYFAKILKVNPGNEKTASIEVDMGLPKATIPAESLVRFAKQMDLGYPIGYAKHFTTLLTTLKKGDVVFVEVRSYDSTKHEGVVELMRRPIVSGGMIAIDDGEVRAVVSGFDTMGYNRAISAIRQPGSVFKSVVYYAGLQLGWSVLDPLDNERRIFPYQGRFYYPRPDHPSPYRNTSMIYAGTLSENLASIYLTANLVEKLSFEQFKSLMGHLELLPKDGEAPRDFHFRVAKALGVELTNMGIQEFELQNAIADIAPDLVFSGKDYLLSRLNKMWYGNGYEAEVKNLYGSEDKAFSTRELALRIDLARNNYLRHNELSQAASIDWEAITKAVSEKGIDSVFNDPAMKIVFERFRVLSSRGSKPSLGYFKLLPNEEPKQIRNSVPLVNYAGRALNLLDAQAIWGGSTIFGNSANISFEDLMLEGYLPVSYLRKIESGLKDRYNNVMAVQDSYDLVRYFHHHDFRIALGLNYLTRLCKQLGVSTPAEAVLSFPLGSNVVTLGEVAKIYQTFVDGKTYKFYEEGTENQLNFIRRIEDRFGNVIYEPKREEFQLTRPELSMGMQQILRKVVTHGTGRRARGELYINLGADAEANAKLSKLTPIRIPAFGKTGTTNDYTTASFAGFVPYPVEPGKSLDPKNSYVIASYVGYDDNTNMRRGGVLVTGAVGALPAWTDFAKAIIESHKFKENFDGFDISVIKKQEWPLVAPEGTAPFAVDLPRGLLAREEDPSAGNENFATTDISATGETGESEFALNTSMRTTVRLAVNPKAPGLSPLRLFAPYQVKEKDNASGQTPAASTVSDPSAPSTTVNEGSSQTINAAPPSRIMGEGGSSPIDQIEEPKDLPLPEANPVNESGNSSSSQLPSTPSKVPTDAGQSPTSDEDLW